MSTPRLDRATALVELLIAAGLLAFTDPGEAMANRPCILIAPPTLDFDLPVGATAAWKLALLAAAPFATRTAWAELDALLESLLVDVVDPHPTLTVDRAEPVPYQLVATSDPVPAYLVTVTEAVPAGGST